MIRNQLLWVSLGVWGALAIPTPSLAQPTVAVDAKPGEKMQLEVGQTQLIKVSQKIIRVSVANPDVCDVQVVTPKQLLVTARTVGYTHITMWGEDDAPVTIAVTSMRNLDELRTQLGQLFPNEKIAVSSAGDLVVLSGQVSDLRLPARAAEVAALYSEKLANLIEVSGDQQVQLDVRFAEVSRSSLRRMGMSFLWSDTTGDGYLGGISELQPGNLVPIPGAPPVPNAATVDAFNLFFSTGLSEFPFSAILSILSQQGFAKVLAEPTLVALSGQQAEFHAGGEIPVLSVQNLGSVNVQWKKFGIILRFQPVVLGAGTMNLKLFVEVSEPDPVNGITLGGFQIPAIKVRSSETTVRLRDGQSFAVAGLLSDQQRQIVRKVPLIGDIPVLGALFRSVSFQREESELLVVVTAHLVEPLSPDEAPRLPLEDVDTDPNDFELFMLGTFKAARDEDRDRERRGGGPPSDGTTPASPRPADGPAPSWTGSTGGGVAGPIGFTRN